MRLPDSKRNYHYGRRAQQPEASFVAILGGAKVSDKIGVITNLLDKVDTLIIGGGMAYTFMNALGYSIGTSLCESDKVELAKDMMAKAKEKGVKFLIPVDNVVATEYKADAEHQIVDSDQIPDGWMGLDIGPKTCTLFSDAIKGSGTVVWNGPMGVSEWENFAAGTIAVAKAVANSGAISIIGGGDSAAAVEKLGFAEKMTHISTGGGASLNSLRVLSFLALRASTINKQVKLVFAKCGSRAAAFEISFIMNRSNMMNKMLRKAVIAGNWKMNKTPAEAKELIEEIKPLVRGANCDVVVCVPYIDLCTALEATKGTNIGVGAENCHWEKSGAFTGEISADMLATMGVQYVIIGHSERRTYFGETDVTVNKRVRAALNSGLTVILCVGEYLEQREQGITSELVSMQTKIALGGVSKEELKKSLLPTSQFGPLAPAKPQLPLRQMRFALPFVPQ